MSAPRALERRAVALFQLVEGGIALGLVWLAIHAPKAAPGLLIAAGLVGVWALIADGPLAPIRVIGLTVHRRGLLLVAFAVAVVPFATGQAHNLEVLLPCLGAAAVLLRLGLVRLAAPAPMPTAASQSGATASAPSDAPSSQVRTASVAPAEAVSIADIPADRTDERRPTAGVVRVTGRLAGRAGSMVTQKTDVAVPRGARAAGRLVGRFRARDHS